jgi:hypothetical protein
MVQRLILDSNLKQGTGILNFGIVCGIRIMRSFKWQFERTIKRDDKYYNITITPVCC